jgi:hypothetical protein
MAPTLSLARLRLGSVTTIKQAEVAIRDIEQQLDLITQLLATPEDGPGAGLIKVLIREDDGKYHLYALAAGAGVTITPDTTNKTITFTSP